mmetsp:Transcript_9588/g.20831  ORF Transcript_9588/g.20831 Transcript_9588/m.20831 type:complete len:443 (-) Transcript_9588:1101-2429(-)
MFLVFRPPDIFPKAELQHRVRSAAVGVGGSRASRSVQGSRVDYVHQLLRIVHGVLAQPGKANLSLAVLQTPHGIPGVQQVQQLSAVDFEQGDADREVCVLGIFGDAEHILGGKEVQAKVGVGGVGTLVPSPHSSGVGAHHGKRLPAPGLPIGEHARPLPPKHPGDQAHHGPLVNLRVVGIFVEDVVERERCRLDLLRQVQLRLGLVDQDSAVRIVVEGVNDVRLEGVGRLAARHRALAHDDADAHLVHGVVLVLVPPGRSASHQALVLVVERLPELPYLGDEGVVHGGSVHEHRAVAAHGRFDPTGRPAGRGRPAVGTPHGGERPVADNAQFRWRACVAGRPLGRRRPIRPRRHRRPDRAHFLGGSPLGRDRSVGGARRRHSPSGRRPSRGGVRRLGPRARRRGGSLETTAPGGRRGGDRRPGDVALAARRGHVQLPARPIA